MHEHEHVLRAAQVTQAMHAAVDQLDAGGQPVDDQVARGARQHRLPAAGDRAQPRTPGQREAEVVALIAQLGIGCVQGDPHPQIEPIRPHDRAQLELGLQRRRHRVRRARERAHHAVALPLLDRADAVMICDRPVEDRVRLRDRARHRVGKPRPQASRAVDIGQHERHRARRHVEPRRLLDPRAQQRVTPYQRCLSPCHAPNVRAHEHDIHLPSGISASNAPDAYRPTSHRDQGNSPALHAEEHSMGCFRRKAGSKAACEAHATLVERTHRLHDALARRALDHNRISGHRQQTTCRQTIRRPAEPLDQLRCERVSARCLRRSVSRCARASIGLFGVRMLNRQLVEPDRLPIVP